MPLSDIIRVSISILSAGLTRAGFGTPLILSHTAAWVERTRTYASLTAVQADFAATTPEYLAASAIFSQQPAPPTVMVGRAVAKPTQRHQIDISAVANSTAYSVRVNQGGVSQTATYTSDGSATHDEIATGLEAALTALAAPTLTGTLALIGSVGSKSVQITGAAAADWLGVEVLDTNLLAVSQTHADPGLATDLTAILNESQAWYALETFYNSSAYVLAAAAWVEANERFYLPATQDTAVITVADATPATDVAHAIKALNYARTAVLYHPANDRFADAAWLGAGLPTQPGSETWKFFTLVGVPATVLTGTQIANLKAKRANWYYGISGKDITTPGMVGAGEWIDVIRFRDWLKARIQEDCFILLTQGAGAAIGLAVPLKKVPYTDAGIALIQNVITADLRAGVDVGGLASAPAPTVVVPKVANVSGADKSARVLNNVNFTGTLAGAIHELVVTGTVSE